MKGMNDNKDFSGEEEKELIRRWRKLKKLEEISIFPLDKFHPLGFKLKLA